MSGDIEICKQTWIDLYLVGFCLARPQILPRPAKQATQRFSVSRDQIKLHGIRAGARASISESHLRSRM